MVKPNNELLVLLKKRKDMAEQYRITGNIACNMEVMMLDYNIKRLNDAEREKVQNE